MKAYKGFNKNKDGKLSCRGFVYEPGKTYKHEGGIELCVSGFHACHELWQTWPFYQNNSKNVFYEVECGGDVIDSVEGDGKFVCSEIRLVKEIDMTYVARFDNAWNFCGGFSKVEFNGKHNFINAEGKLLSERWFDDAYNFFEGFARINLDGKWNYINTEGKIMLEQWFDDAWWFCGGFAKVKLYGKLNFIDTRGKLLSERWFDDAYNFFEGFARVLLNGKYNFINAEGKLLSEQWFDNALDFSGGFADVKIEGKWKKINTKGEIVL